MVVQLFVFPDVAIVFILMRMSMPFFMRVYVCVPVSVFVSVSVSVFVFVFVFVLVFVFVFVPRSALVSARCCKDVWMYSKLAHRLPYVVLSPCLNLHQYGS